MTGRSASRSAKSISNPTPLSRPPTASTWARRSRSFSSCGYLPWVASRVDYRIRLFLTIMGIFLMMYFDGNLLMKRISLGALIIALCMLTDNAIVITEAIKVRIESGEDKLHMIRDVISQNQWPLFGAMAIAVVAFAAIGLSEDRTGEYCNSLFWLIFISLALNTMAVRERLTARASLLTAEITPVM